jgi:hypothetical protein
MLKLINASILFIGIGTLNSNIASADIFEAHITNPTGHSVSTSYNLTNQECSDIQLHVNHVFNFWGFSKKHYFLHRSMNGSTQNISQYTTSIKPTFKPKKRIVDFDFSFSQASNSTAHYVVRQTRKATRRIVITCSQSASSGSSSTSSSGSNAKPYCPRAVPNYLGLLSNKSVCMAKWPNKIKSSKCNKKGGMKWDATSGSEYCLWGKSNYWHARPTK